MSEKINRFLREQTPDSLRPADRLKVNGLSWKKGNPFVPRRAQVFWRVGHVDKTWPARKKKLTRESRQPWKDTPIILMCASKVLNLSLKIQIYCRCTFSSGSCKLEILVMGHQFTGGEITSCPAWIIILHPGLTIDKDFLHNFFMNILMVMIIIIALKYCLLLSSPLSVT